MVKAATPKERFFSPIDLVQDSKHLRIAVTGLRPIEEAISTVGGIRPADLTPAFAIAQRVVLVFFAGIGWSAMKRFQHA